MGNRFTVKDFIFLCIFIAIVIILGLTLGSYNYLTHQVAGLRGDLQNMEAQQTSELYVLKKLQRDGIRMNARGTHTGQSASTADIRKTLPDGSRYVMFPNPPQPPYNPYAKPDFAYGDWLVESLESEPNRIMPYVPQSESAQTIQASVLESLLVRNPLTLKYDPWLARSYTLSKNGLKITFVLRRRARFSNGKPVTAQDVVFSYDTMMNPKVNCAPIRSYYTDIKSCRALSARTVVFTFNQPYFKALGIAGGLPIIPKSVYDFPKISEFNSHGKLLVGSGPYVLKRWTAGQDIVLTRNPRYWGPRPIFNRLVYRFISNPQAALQSLLAGQIDADVLEPSQWLKYHKNKSFRAHFTTYKYLSSASGYNFICWNLRKPWFKNRRTRVALAMLVNEPAMIKTFMHGMAVQNVGPFNPVSPQNDPHIKPIPYDPAKARRELKKAGWSMGTDGLLHRGKTVFRFGLTIPSQFPLGKRIAEYIKQQFASAGINMQINPLDFSTLLQKINHRHFDAVMLGWSGSIENDPYQIWYSGSYKNEGSNAGDFDDPLADKLILEGRRTLNYKKRMHIWHELQAEIYRQQPYLFMFTSYDLIAINKRIKNTKPYPVTGVDAADWFVPLALQKYR
jgi:peptide/nickel transport system substrate-binding protein